jgi:HK97 family phage prohead protease
MTEKQYRTFEFKILKADSDAKVGYLEGYASTFGNVDQGLDVVDRGAFTKTIKDNKGVFPILIDHDPGQPWGWNLRASEDDRGLKVAGEVQLITPEQQNRYALAKRAQELGKAMGLSIGYSTIKADNDFDQPQVRHLKELKLWEYSQVTFPMNTEASLTGVKGLKPFGELFARLQKQGYDEEELFSALVGLLGTKADPAANLEVDPEILQSMDALIGKFRG